MISDRRGSSSRARRSAESSRTSAARSNCVDRDPVELRAPLRARGDEVVLAVQHALPTARPPAISARVRAGVGLRAHSSVVLGAAVGLPAASKASIAVGVSGA